jgi:UDP-N-acetyl-alpha-D-muramoyl-L-alanyl-L-glutamate epimerase
MPSHDRFLYDGFAIDPAGSVVTCRYATAGHTFTERFTFESGGDWTDPAVVAAVRILYLLAGVSYYKTSAAPLIDLGDLATTASERDFLHSYYVNGLGEFAYRNGLDLRGVQLQGPDAAPAPPVAYEPEPDRPLIPFGGGVDSIVTVESVAGDHPGAALCVVEPPGDRFVAIEDAAAVTGLPVTRITRRIDPLVRRSAELGFLNGHVPVTAIITAAALVAAVLERRDAVVLSNEWSASVPTVVADGLAVNHQWSKGELFERAFGELVLSTLGPGISVFSYLRPRSELWVAQQFARLGRYHAVFRSCNRAFHQDPAQRLDHWCGRCDKCCFIDLVLAPFVDRAELSAVFAGDEPLEDPANEERFRALLGLGEGAKPFECVGDTDECRAATLLAAQREDRVGNQLLAGLRAELVGVAQAVAPDPASLLEPRGPHRIPDRYAPADLLVRAR